MFIALIRCDMHNKVVILQLVQSTKEISFFKYNTVQYKHKYSACYLHALAFACFPPGTTFFSLLCTPGFAAGFTASCTVGYLKGGPMPFDNGSFVGCLPCDLTWAACSVGFEIWPAVAWIGRPFTDGPWV